MGIIPPHHTSHSYYSQFNGGLIASPTNLKCALIRNVCFLSLTHTEKNGLSFIETSALDSTNVETAFQNILTGKVFMHRTSMNNLHHPYCSLFLSSILILVCPAEIYHIVSKSSTANDAPTGQEIGESKTIIPAEVWSL